MTPYRLDLTVDALRRVKVNAVDVTRADARYLRALSGPGGVDIVKVRQVRPDELDVRVIGGRWAIAAEDGKPAIGPTSTCGAGIAA